MIGVADSYDYFMDGRKWFFGGLLLVVGLDTVDSFLKSLEWGLRPIFIPPSAAHVLVAPAGIASRRRSVKLSGAVVCFFLQLLYMFSEVGVLGSW